MKGSYKGAKAKGTSDSWANRRKGSNAKASTTPKSGKQMVKGAKVAKGYATC